MLLLFFFFFFFFSCFFQIASLLSSLFCVFISKLRLQLRPTDQLFVQMPRSSECVQEKEAAAENMKMRKEEEKSKKWGGEDSKQNYYLSLTHSFIRFFFLASIFLTSSFLCTTWMWSILFLYLYLNFGCEDNSSGYSQGTIN